MRCVIHGSFRRHFEEISRVHRLFTAAGIEVLAPAFSAVREVRDGFALLESDAEADPRVIELAYLSHLKRLGPDGFSYFVNPEGYLGKSAAYELGIAQATNVRCFFSAPPADLPVYHPRGAVIAPETLAAHVAEIGTSPEPLLRRDERAIQRLWEELLVPGSVVAVGGIIEHAPAGAGREREVLLVQTHKWGGRYSVVGGKVRRGERLDDALRREVAEETGLVGGIGRHLCTFDQLKDSGYYRHGTQHLFVDKVVEVASKRVRLNDEAEGYVWATPRRALDELDIEPNARHTLELYAAAL